MGNKALSWLVGSALQFAADAHAGQRRKYTEKPYMTHPLAVWKMVQEAGEPTHVQAAALLHDVVEDTDATEEDIRDKFGPDVADLVMWLTDVSKPEDGNRKVRKAMDREHIAGAPSEAKTIKLADLIDNAGSIVPYDPKFAKVYMQEKRDLLLVLKGGDRLLWNRADKIVQSYFAGR